MRYVSIPAPIALKNKFTDEVSEPTTFKTFVIGVILTDAKWIKSYADVRAAAAIETALDSTGVMVLDSADWEKLKAVTESPSQGYSNFTSLGMMQLIPFLDAIMNATDKPPALTEVPA